MTTFAEASEKLLELVGQGLTMRDACTRLDLPYSTARGWVADGRRTPKGRYGEFAAKLAAARNAPRVETAVGGPGAISQSVEDRLAGQELTGDGEITAQMARALALKADQLADATGGQAGIALSRVSERLESLLAGLQLPHEDELDRLRAGVAARRAALHARGSQKKGERPIDVPDADEEPDPVARSRPRVTTHATSANGRQW